MRISDWSSDVCSSDLYPLRVGDRGRLALAPERPHLGPFVQMGVSDDRARGLDELPMPEHIAQRCSRHGGQPRQRGLAAPEQGGEALLPFPVAIIKTGRTHKAFEYRTTLRASRAVPARRLPQGEPLDRPP